jgi:TolB protein
MNRREFLALTASASLVTFLSPQCASAATTARRERRLLFVSQGRTGMVQSGGGGLRYFDFHIPNQATWQPGPVFPDGRRVIFLSMEPRRDGPGKPFEQYYTQTPTHLW